MFIMAYKIQDTCVSCGSCASECPVGAISQGDTQFQIDESACIECGNCASHCPTGAITMVAYDPDDSNSPKVPFIDEERCIGCGACEHVCPSRPFSAIYVEGNDIQRTI